jgi:1,4-dihydroxy-2-naphthoyl-CoA synthase
VNAVVPAADLLSEAKSWVAEIAAMSPTAIRFLKHSFNTDTEHQAGLANVATAGLELFTHTPEGQEGPAAFAAKRAPDFASHAF